MAYFYRNEEVGTPTEGPVSGLGWSWSGEAEGEASISTDSGANASGSASSSSGGGGGGGGQQQIVTTLGEPEWQMDVIPYCMASTPDLMQYAICTAKYKDLPTEPFYKEQVGPFCMSHFGRVDQIGQCAAKYKDLPTFDLYVRFQGCKNRFKLGSSDYIKCMTEAASGTVYNKKPAIVADSKPQQDQIMEPQPEAASEFPWMYVIAGVVGVGVLAGVYYATKK